MSACKKKKKPQPSEIYLALKTSLKLFQAPFYQLSDEQRALVQSEVKNEYALQQKILQTAEVASVKVDEQSLDQSVNCIRNRYPDSQSFEKDLQSNGLDEKTLRAALLEEFKAELVLAHVAESAPAVTDKEISDYYHGHQEKFRTEEMRFARHILITINPAFTENSPANARKRLTAIQRKLAKDPKQFPRFAALYSECPSALKQGSLGRVGRDQLFPQLTQALFQLAEGAISEIVETEMGLHLVSCEKIWPAEKISLKDAHRAIRAALEKRRRLSHQKNWLRSLLAEPQAKAH